MALLLCIAASGSGAFLVRAVRGHRQPLLLAPSPAPTLAQASSARLPSEPKAPVAADPSPAPQVVDIASLSIERRAPRAVARPVVVAPAKPAPATSGDSNDTEPAPAASAAQKPKPVDLFAAERENAQAGAADKSSTKKATAPSDDAPGF
jgi:hypothetical protein